MASKYVVISGVSLPVEIIKSKRKTLGIQCCRGDKLIVRAPFSLAYDSVVRMLEKRNDLLEKFVLQSKENERKYENIETYSQSELDSIAERAREIIPQRVKFYAEIIGVSYGKITIRKQKTRWGSCSSTGNLSFNMLLAEAPADVLDAIVVHELCHRKQMNHSKEFYAEVYKVLPDYDERKKWLKENGNILIRRMTG